MNSGALVSIENKFGETPLDRAQASVAQTLQGILSICPLITLSLCLAFTIAQFTIVVLIHFQFLLLTDSCVDQAFLLAFCL